MRTYDMEKQNNRNGDRRRGKAIEPFSPASHHQEIFNGPDNPREIEPENGEAITAFSRTGGYDKKNILAERRDEEQKKKVRRRCRAS